MFSFIRKNWNERAAVDLSILLNNTEMEYLKDNIESGSVHLYNIEAEKEHKGTAVFRIDNLGFRKDLVNLYAVGKGIRKEDGYISFSEAVFALAKYLAKLNDCNYIRVHTSFDNVEKILKKLKFETLEKIYLKEVE